MGRDDEIRRRAREGRPTYVDEVTPYAFRQELRRRRALGDLSDAELEEALVAELARRKKRGG